MSIGGWARQTAVGFFLGPQTCCADEFFQLEGARYDLERLGIRRVLVPEEADVLVIPGWVNEQLLPELKDLYARMAFPKKVMALGVCACGTGPWVHESQWKSPVDIFVPGCPPRPESIMEGFLRLKELLGRGDYAQEH